MSKIIRTEKPSVLPFYAAGGRGARAVRGAAGV